MEGRAGPWAEHKASVTRGKIGHIERRGGKESVGLIGVLFPSKHKSTMTGVRRGARSGLCHAAPMPQPPRLTASKHRDLLHPSHQEMLKLQEMTCSGRSMLLRE